MGKRRADLSPDDVAAIINEVFDALYRDVTGTSPSSTLNWEGERIQVYTQGDIEGGLAMLNKHYLRQVAERRPIGDWV